MQKDLKEKIISNKCTVCVSILVIANQIDLKQFIKLNFSSKITFTTYLL